MKKRYNLAFEILGDLTGKAVLDIGCGTGRYMFEALRHNAAEVLGIDAAPGAIESAKKLALDEGFAGKAGFETIEFLDFRADRKYDVIFAVGYFDYILDPLTHLTKMMAISDGSLYASFPKRWHFMTPVRKTRLSLFNNCPVRFYSLNGIRQLTIAAGCKNFDIRSVDRDFILIADTKR